MNEQTTLLQSCQIIREQRRIIDEIIDRSAQGPIRLNYEESSALAKSEQFRQTVLAGLKQQGIDTTARLTKFQA
jgi:hypothetical protein